MKLAKRAGYGLVSLMMSLGLVFYGLQPVIARAESTPVTASDTSPTNTTTSTPTDTTTTSSSPTGDTTTTSSSPAVIPTEMPTPTPDPTSSPSPTPTTNSQTQTGPVSPTGDASSSYVLNPITGMWENDHYIWDPITHQTTPKDPVNYSYNPTTKMWDTTQWIFNAASGKYEPNIVSTSTPPLGSVTLNNSDQPLAVTSLSSGINPAGVGDKSNQPTSAANVLNGTSKTNGFFDLFYNASISNDITSNAQSGDATVSSNTNGGSATSGDASAFLNLINMINSSWGLASANPLMFVANLVGSVFGDIFLNPSNLGKNTVNTSSANDVTVNANANGAINNTIDLGSVSGDATVQLNTNAGDATTGNANTMANVMNLLNTSIGTGQSFLGMINIYGDLNGDILLPPGVLDSLLASNTPSAINNTNTKVSNNLNANLSDTTTINNQVNATAQSGSAAVSKNTTAGDATTGNASTNVTLLNLTGRKVVGKDALLVFVNVLGKWVGMIVNAPNGATSGALAGGITQNTTIDNNVNVNANSNNLINNLINASATSGNALVDSNTHAGNATSGDARVGVNVVNIANSDFNLSDWFGVLFINVFGNWYGSFGVNTDAGNPIKTPKATDAAGKVFSFLPKSSSSQTSLRGYYGGGGSESADPVNSLTSETPTGKVLGATNLAGPSLPTAIAVKSGFGFIQYAMFVLTIIAIISTSIYWWKTRDSQYYKIVR